ncbi:MAG: hypothetical protein ABI972_13410 [Acidobacteriota bacterium]
MKIPSFASDDFWNLYDKLPADVQRLADKQFEIFERDPRHPSLHLKKVGPFWSARVGIDFRVVARFRSGGMYWFWIGSHTDYKKLLRS